MMHFEAGTIQALMHGELPPAEQAEAVRHQTMCEPCRTAVERARREDTWVRGRLAVLDRTPPAVADVMPRVQRAPHRARWSRAATLLVLLGGAGLAWAMPAVRDPVRAWLGGAARGAPAAVADLPPAPQVATSAASAGSGVSVAPGARFTVSISVTGGAGTLFVRVVEAADVSVRASGSNVSLESQDDALLVRNPGGDGDYFVEIPRAAPRVEVRVNDTRLVLVERGAVMPAGAPLATEWMSYPVR